MSREPLSAERLAELVAPWRVEVHEDTGSTNADAAEAGRGGEPEGLIVAAEAQHAGRGRQGRSWVVPPRASLALSILLRPSVGMAGWGWLPLLAGVAVAESVRELYAVDADLKWPNDLLVTGRKCAGILAETVPGGAVVVGIGLNVWQTADELPTTPTGLPATSLALAGAEGLDRTVLAAAVVQRFRQRYDSWQLAQGNPDRSGLRDAYLKVCGTVGREVRILLPGNAERAGIASTVDAEGRLVVRDLAGGEIAVAAGDVTHVR